MKKISLLFILIILVIFCSCGSAMYLSSRDKIMALELGLTKSEVINILGKPNYRTKSDDINEIWEYKDMVPGGYDMVKLNFDNDKVVSFDSYFLQDVAILSNTDTKTN